MVKVMKRRFKSKRRRKTNILFILIVIIFIIYLSFKLIKNDNCQFLLNNQLNSCNFVFNRENILLKSGLNINYHEYDIEKEISKEVFEEIEKLPTRSIYIYNTHQTEEYQDYDVFLASKKLQEELTKYNIEAIVEESNIPALIKEHNYVYSQSYRITKELLEKNMNDDISLYIDLHRDSSKRSISTTTIDDINYARIMFVVGGKHDNYMDNYQVSEELNKMIKNINPLLSRGILLRKSSSYNQDLASNIILIELGGPENTQEEVSNSLKLLALAINNYLNE